MVLQTKLARPLPVGFLPKWNRTLAIEVSVLCVLCASLWSYGISQVGDYRIDDAYITFAYSKNLATGHGPVYGHGMKVEGYSNFLWMVLVALGELVGADPMTTARAFGHLFFGLTLGSTWLVARKWSGPIAALVVTGCLASSSDFHRSIQSGLETVAFCGFLAAGFCHYVVEDPARRKWSLLWFSGAALSRIDGFGSLGLLLGLEGVRWLLGGRKESFRVLFRWALVGIAPVAVYWLWRYFYYGLPFPLTYYAKASLAADMKYRGAAYVWNALQDTGLWIAVLLGAFGLGKNVRLGGFVFVGFVTGYLGYVIHVGGDWMPVNRMVLPVFAPLFMLSSTALAHVMSSWVLPKKLTEAFLGVVFVAGHAWCAVFLNQASIDTPFEERKVADSENILLHTKKLLEAQPFVEAIVRKPGDVLVTDYGGVFAYDTQASVIEMWGLANRDIALRGNTEGVAAIYGKTCVPCYAEFEPDYFHSIVPLLRGPNDIRSRRQMIHQVFQGAAIDRVIGLYKNYRVGRVTRTATGETLWFLERERKGAPFETRQVGDLTVDYPPLR